MSYRKERFLKYKQSDILSELNYVDKMSDEDIYNLFHEVLNGGVHGFCFSLYDVGQGPGTIVSEDQIRRRIKILQPYTDWIRTFSCTESNELIPVIAKEYGLKTLVGAWLGSDEVKNQQEIEGLIQLAKDGYVDIAAVGNEVLYRKDLNENELINYIKFVKQQLKGIPVGYVDAYYEFVQRPNITELCDVILCNCYPFWEGTSFEDSFQHMRQMYDQSKNASKGKRVIITETGWPSHGESLGGAIPSRVQCDEIFHKHPIFGLMTKTSKCSISPLFDESWKIGNEGEVGAYWGIWDNAGKLKY